MSIVPLPVFEADADPHHRSAMTDQEIYDRLESPKTIVVKFGFMKLIGEYPYDGDAKPGCGSKLVARTHRGTELVEMLTTTCENAGCSKSITRRELLDYIENSGGKDYPFYSSGRILRVATVEDLNRQSALGQDQPQQIKRCRELIREYRLPMKLVEAEAILGGELLTFYYMSEERVDFRELVRQLASEFKTRIEMRQVGARDEARLVADYERCGQHCCCKNFLKVLKPVSMKSAKVQKATLDPLKISGRCGRLMCCLRYEDQTYKELKKNLPRRNKRVGTSEGPGVVVDTKILVQLALVRLEHDNREIAVPVEELMDPDNCPAPGSLTKPEHEADPLRGLSEKDVRDRTDDRKRGRQRKRGERKSKDQQQDEFRAKSRETDPERKRSGDQPGEGGKGRKPRRRRKPRGSRKGEGTAPSSGQPGPEKGGPPKAARDGGDGGGGDDGGKPGRKRRRPRGGRGRRDGGKGPGEGSGGGGSHGDH